jgi:hypothetical protein
MFTWTIDSITNRISKGRQQQQQHLHSMSSSTGSSKMSKEVRDTSQAAAEAAFQKQKHFFSDPKRVPYPLQGDVGRMQTKRESSDEGKQARYKAYAENVAKHNDDEGGVGEDSRGSKRQRSSVSTSSHTPAYFRQRAALNRQNAPLDDEDSKILRYSINFTENCNVMEDDVEIYEFISPTNSITRGSLLYGTVPTPLSHILIDYRNIRTTQIRQAYADSYNTQVSVCVCWDAVLYSHRCCFFYTCAQLFYTCLFYCRQS